jgi:hypothetical protein
LSQATQTVTVSKGTLATTLAGVANVVEDLTILGSINSSDVIFMRDNLPKLSRLDMSNVTITDNTLPANAFYYTASSTGKTSLTSVKLPNNLTSIGSYAFCGCFGITSINIPDLVTKIDNYAFYGCTEITDTLVIPDLVTNIGAHAFYGCKKISSVKLGSSLITIDSYAFYGCSGITDTIVIPNSVTNISTYTFYNCTGLPSVKLGNSMAAISSYAFYGCSGITDTIVIPNSVTSISNNAFNGCSMMSGVKFGNSLQSIGTYAFYNCREIANALIIPNSVTSIGSHTFYGCSKIPSVELSNAMTAISNYTFYNCSGITNKLTIPESVQTIGANAFYKCSKIRDTLVIPNSVISIGGSAFYNCDSLTSVKLGNSVQTIGSEAFYNCAQIKDTLIIPNSVTSIGNNAFYSCKGLTSVKLGSGLKTIGNEAFRICNNITDTLFIPNSVTSIGDFAFNDCVLLPSVKLGRSVVTIGKNAFYGCSSIKGSLIIPDSTNTIGEYAFYNCNNLTSLKLGRSVLTIGKNAFQNCTEIKDTLIIPNSVISIGVSAFQNLGKLQSLTLGSSLETIGNNAFQSCTSLTEIINLRTTPISIPEATNSTNIFRYILTATCELKVSSASYDRYNAATGWKNYLRRRSVDSVSVSVIVTNPLLGWVSGIETRFYPRNSVLNLEAHPMPGLQLMSWTSGEVEIGYGSTLQLEAIQDTVIYVMFGTEVTVATCTPGTFGETLRSIIDPSGVTHLTIKCNIDARDVKYMRDSLYSLSFLDLSEATLVAYSGLDGTSSSTNPIPNYPANSMPAYSFQNKTMLLSVKLPENITDIGNNAFNGCHGIKDTVIIPNTVVSIGSNAFYACNKLPFVKFGRSVTSIGSNTFYNCSGIKGTLTIPALVSSIGSYAFYSCSGISGALIIPDSVTSIGPYAFCECNKLSSVKLGRSVQTIGSCAFRNCSKINTAIIIPNSVTSIEGSAFSGCSMLPSLVLGSEVQTIGSSILSSCSAITEIINLRSIPVNTTNNVLFSISTTPCKLKVSDASYNRYQAVDVWKNHLCGNGNDGRVSVSVVVTNPFLGWVSGVEPRFYQLNDQLELTGKPIPGYTLVNWTSNGVEIGSGNTLSLTLTQDTVIYATFGVKIDVMGCTPGTLGATVHQMVDPSVVTHLTVKCNIDARDVKFMRDSMPELAYLDLSEATIAAYSGLGGTSSTINPVPNYSANAMPTNSFRTSPGNIKLKSMKLPESITVINSYAFYNCTGITDTVVIPNSVKSISNYAFYGCNKIPSVKLGSGLQTINAYVFQFCSGIKDTLIIPNSVTSIGAYAFNACSGIPHIKLGNSLQTIATGAFESCSGIKSLTIPSSVTSIGTYAFSNCSKLKSLTLSNTETVISNYAFRSCTSITEIINLKTTPIIISDNVFNGLNKSNCELKVSTTSYPLYAQALVWKDFLKVNMGHRIIIYSANPELGDVSGVDSYFYPDGANLTLTGTPNTGFNFINWVSEKREISADRIFSFTLTQDMIISAFFGIRKDIESCSSGAGFLQNELTATEKATLTYLSVKCDINAVDIKFMRDSMPQLSHINLSEANIVEYVGTGGTYSSSSITYPANVMPSRAFLNKATLIGISMPSNLVEIGAEAFNGCTSLLGPLVIPDNVTKIGSKAFRLCANLSSELHLPNVLEEISSEAFLGCSSLFGELHLPNSLTTIGTSAFNACYFLTGTLRIPPDVKTINSNTFFSCSRISTVIIENTVSTIGANAFNGCTSLTTIINKRLTPQVINASVFQEVDKNACRLLVHSEALNTYAAANVWKEFLNLGIDDGILYVKQNSAGNGINWGKALPGVAEALETVRSYGKYGQDIVKQIWVAEGVYIPKYIPDSALNAGTLSLIARDRAFSLIPGVKLYGGFPANANDNEHKDLSSRNWRVHSTVLSGDLSGNDIRGNLSINRTDNARHVVIAAGHMIHGTDTARLDGFVVTGGQGTGSVSITVNGVTNIRSDYSSGIYSASTAMVFANDSIVENRTANYGGGLYSSYDTSSYTNMVISGNTAEYGGGIFINAGSLSTFTNTLISGNSSTVSSISSGGGVYHFDGTSTFTNVTIVGNRTNDNGGGIFKNNSGVLNLRNSIVAGNVADNGSGNNVYGSVTHSRNLVEDVSVEGIISSANPLFVASDTAKAGMPTTGGDFRLQAGSPAINVGDNSPISGVVVDLDGNMRVQGCTVDLGAYENPHTIAPDNGIVYVKQGSNGNMDGSSWNNAYSDLAHPLYLAQTGACGDITEIRVAAGTYTPKYMPPTTNAISARDHTFAMTRGVKLYGGFPADAVDGTDMSARDWRTNLTVLSGDLNDDDASGSISNNAYHVVSAIGPMVRGEDTARLDGFVVTGGYASGSTDIIVNGVPNIFRNNSGGIYSHSTAMTFANNSIVGNKATGAGGGIHSSADTSSYTNMVISSNTSDNSGGGVYIHTGSLLTFTNTLISGNIANVYGGGVSVFGGLSTFTNVTIVGNYAKNNGGGIHNTGISNLLNSIVWGNVAGGDNNNLNGNFTCSHSLVESSSAAGIISAANPLFVAPVIATENSPATGGDFRLQKDSPAINVGDSNLISDIAKDIDGNARVQGCTVDLGAYENPHAIAPDNGIVYVKQGGNGNMDGSSWNNAYSDLAHPLYLAQTGACGDITEIRVAAGTYTPKYMPPTTDAVSARDHTFAMTRGVKLYGGFPANAADGMDMSARDRCANLTVLSGDLNGDDIAGNMTDNKSDNAYHVAIAAGPMIRETDTARLDGFVVTGGNGTGSSAITVNGVSNISGHYGGGIVSASTAMTFANDSIAGNKANQGGGGIYSISDTSSYTNMIISGNNAYIGGGTYINSGNQQFTNALISGNTASANGGGIYINNGAPAFAGALIIGNIAKTDGGGVFHHDGTSTFINATIAGCRANTNGGGVYKDNNGTMKLQNSIIWGNNNTAGNTNKNVYGSPTHSHNLVENGTVNMNSKSIISQADPLFANLVSAPDLNTPAIGGDFRLKAGSPAINVGDNDLTPANLTADLAGSQRSVGIIDLGAYESQTIDDYVLTTVSTPIMPVKIDVLANDCLGACTYATLDLFDIISGKGPHHGTLTIESNNTLTYTPDSGYFGLDSLDYNWRCSSVTAQARVYIMILKPLSDEYRACPEDSVTAGFKNVPGVTFDWYDNKETLIKSSADSITLHRNFDTLQILYAEPNWNGIRYLRDTVLLHIGPDCICVPPEVHDIRITLCPYPSRTVNLTSFLDSLPNVNTVEWIQPNLQNFIDVSTGTLNSAQFLSHGTFTYTYSRISKCSAIPSIAKTYIYVPNPNDAVLRHPDTVMVCTSNTTMVNVTGMFGLELGGTWEYDDTVNSDNTVFDNTVEVVPPSQHAGAVIFNAKNAHAIAGNNYNVNYRDVAGKKFAFKYSYTPSAGVTNTKQIVIVTY